MIYISRLNPLLNQSQSVSGMALSMIVLLALSVLGFTPSRAGECEWDVRLCKTEPLSTGLCRLWTAVMEVQDLKPMEMQKNVSSHS